MVNIINEEEMKNEIKKCYICYKDTGNFIPIRLQYESWVVNTDYFEFRFENDYICVKCLIKVGLEL